MDDKDKEREQFLAEVLSRVSGARVLYLHGTKSVVSIAREGEVELELKHVTLPRSVNKVVNFLQGNIARLQQTGESRLTVVAGLDKLQLFTDKVSFDVGFARDVLEQPDPKQEAKDTKLAAAAPAPEKFKVNGGEDAPLPKK